MSLWSFKVRWDDINGGFMVKIIMLGKMKSFLHSLHCLLKLIWAQAQSGTSNCSSSVLAFPAWLHDTQGSMVPCLEQSWGWFPGDAAQWRAMGGTRRDNDCWPGVGLSAEGALRLIIKQESPCPLSIAFISPSLPMLTVSYFLCKQKELL